MPDSPARSLGVRSDLASRASWALVCAHPGHELRAYHFLEQARPTVFVLTDGSGGGASSRAHFSRSLIAGAGGTVAEPFGGLTDRDAYSAIMSGDARPFLSFAEALTETLLDERIMAVAVDAAEGYNPVHDLCRWIGGAAASAAAACRGRAIPVYELDLVGPPDGDGEGLRFRLDDGALERKLAAADAYEPLREETAAALGRFGRDAFRVEFLRRTGADVLPDDSWVPHYERVGTERVHDGRYTTVLRYGAHVKPVAARLLDAAARHAATVGTADQ